MKFRALLISFSLLVLISVSIPQPAVSQCAMCRAVAESGHETSERKIGDGLNSGILYLLSVPYLLGGAAFWIWHRNRRKA
ncbi:MAG TPA: hypothetical protein VFW78_02005 [Bacteroidia bacterium]|nr:hypothetical protein [Bacteroidia bacterium]